MTHKTKQIEQKQEVLGWLIALDAVIVGFLQSMFPQFMSITAVDWFFTIFFVFLCFWDRNLLKTQDSWSKNKIAWGWCLFLPVYLYKRARVLKESLLKFWIFLVSGIFCTIYGMIMMNQLTPVFKNTIFKDCAYELSRYGADKDKTEDICWSKQMIFNQCVDNLMDMGTNPNMIMDICNERIYKINLCTEIMVKESEINMETAFEICICFSIYDEQYCFNKYGITE